jgi:prolyl 4-hydroxylase
MHPPPRSCDHLLPHNVCIAVIEERIARWALLPVGHQENMQVLKYGAGQQYRPHWDFFQVCLRAEGMRVAGAVRV